MTRYRGRATKPTALLWLLVLVADVAFTAAGGAGVVLCCALAALAVTVPMYRRMAEVVASRT